MRLVNVILKPCLNQVRIVDPMPLLKSKQFRECDLRLRRLAEREYVAGTPFPVRDEQSDGKNEGRDKEQ